MSSVEPVEPTPEQQAAIMLDTIRTHMALVSDDVIGLYLGAAVARIALDAEKTPREVVESMLAEGVFKDGDEWERQRRQLRNFHRITRARFAAAGVWTRSRDGSQN